jgi:hypothetical protein
MTPTLAAFARLPLAVLSLVLAMACGRTHGLTGTDEDAAARGAIDHTHAGAGTKAAEGGTSAAAGRGGGGRSTSGADTSSGTGGSGAPMHAGPAGDGGVPRIAPNIPQLPVGIVVADGATLPAGLWVGETRSAQACATSGGNGLPSGSRQVTLQLTQTGNTAAQGIAVFGDRQVAPPMATNPDVGYPVAGDRFGSTCREYYPSAGYPYAIRDGHVSVGARFDFRIAVVELYSNWCALQTSYETPGPLGVSSSAYSCMPPIGIQNYQLCQSTPEQCPMSASKFEICKTDAICVCLPDGCYANLNRTFRFDLRVEGQNMIGLLVRAGSNELAPTEIKLRRVE